MESSFNMKELTFSELFEIDGGINWWVVAGGVALVAASVAVAVFLPAASPLVAYTLSRVGVAVFTGGLLI